MMALYLQANLLILVSYLSFTLSKGRGLRIAQSLLLTALVLPACFLFLPQHSFPRLPEKILMPLAEVEETILTRESSVVVAPVALAPRAPHSQREIPWLVIAFTSFLLWIGWECFRLLSLLRRAMPIRRIGKVSILLSDEIQIPFSTLMNGRATVVIPGSLVSHWSDFKIALRHELQHHRQKDTHWALFIEVLSVTFALNPFIHLWKRKIHELQELSCDEALIGRKVSSYEYGSCLVRVAETALNSRPMLVGTASMAAGSFLKRRIEMLDSYKIPRPKPWLAGAFALVSTVAVAYGSQQVRETVLPAIVVEPEIQKIAEDALTAALRRHKAESGLVVVSDPKTGRILATTSQQALTSPIAPASIAKAIITSAAIDVGATTKDEMHACENGKYILGGKTFHDWQPFSKLTTQDSVVHSSNICGIKIAEKLGTKRLTEALAKFGFTQVSETAQTDSELFLGTAVNGSSGFYVTPLEVVQFFGALANGGTLMEPQFRKSADPKTVRRILSEETTKTMAGVLKNVLIYGTAMKSRSKLYDLAGKTATGYIRDSETEKLASFVGFAPADSPRVVVYVLLENPTDQKGVHGSYHAAPVFREVAEKTLQYLKVPTL